MRALLRPALVALLATGCLPDRDNPNDNANAPNPVLAVVDRTVDGACQTEDPLENWPAVPFAYRGACLALDARNTTDPQGTSLDELRFSFERISLDEGVIDTIDELGVGGPLLVLDSSAVRTFAIGPAYFRVTVRDPSGAVGTAITSLTIVDRAPIVARQPPRILPIGPPASTEDVILAGRAFDPDADPITEWRWTDETGAVVASTSNATLTIATGALSRRIFKVEAFDGDLWSQPQRASIRVEPRTTWVVGESDPSTSILETFGRIGDRRVFSSLYDAANVELDVRLTNGIAFRTSAGQSRAIVSTSDRLLSLLDWPSLTVLDTYDVPFAYVPLGLHFDETGRVWAASQTFTQGTDVRQVVALETVNDVLTPVFPGNVETVPADFSQDLNDTIGVELERDSDGFLWVAARREPSLRAFAPAASSLDLAGVIAADPSTVFKSVTRRPGDRGVWAVQGQSLVGQLPAPAVLVHAWIENGALVREDMVLDSADADGLLWADEDRFWISLAERGLCRVDMRVLESGGSLEAAIEVEYVTSSSFSFGVLDPLTGGGWWSSDFSTLVASLDPDGEVTVRQADARVHAIDPDGNLFFILDPDVSGYGALARGDAPGRGAVATDMTSTAIALVGDGEGGLWIASLQPKALRHVAADGTTLDLVTSLDVEGTTTAIPATIGIGFDGDDRLLLHGIHDLEVGIIRTLAVDLTGRVPGSNTPLPAEVLFEEVVFTGARFHVASPQAGGHFFYFDLFGGVIARRDADGGNPATVFNPTGTETWRAGLSRDGALCVADRTNATTETISTISPAGVASVTTALTFSTQPSSIGAGYTIDHATDIEICWVAVRELEPVTFRPRLLLLGYDAGGTLVRSWVDPSFDDGDVHSMSPVTNDRVLLIREIGGARRVQSIEWDLTGEPSLQDHGPTEYFDFVEP